MTKRKYIILFLFLFILMAVSIGTSAWIITFQSEPFGIDPFTGYSITDTYGSKVNLNKLNASTYYYKTSADSEFEILTEDSYLDVGNYEIMADNQSYDYVITKRPVRLSNYVLEKDYNPILYTVAENGNIKINTKISDTGGFVARELLNENNFSVVWSDGSNTRLAETEYSFITNITNGKEINGALQMFSLNTRVYEGNTYRASVVLSSKNYEWDREASLANKDSTNTIEYFYIKYKTVKIDNKYYTLEDALAYAEGESDDIKITLCGNESIKKLNYNSTTTYNLYSSYSDYTTHTATTKVPDTDDYVATSFTSLDKYPDSTNAAVTTKKIHNISENVTLLLPWRNGEDSNLTQKTDGPTLTNTKYTDSSSDKSANRLTSVKDDADYYYNAVCAVLNVPYGVTVNVNGTLDVGARIYANGMFSTKERSVIINDGTINVKKSINAYGYVKGSGNIELYSGAVATDMFMIYDFKGGADTYGMHDQAANVFPFNAYSIHNISCNIKINSASTYRSHYALYMGGQLISSDGYGYITVVGEGGLFEIRNDDGYILKRAENADSSTDNYLNTITGSNQEKGQKDIVSIYANCIDNSVGVTIDLGVAGAKVEFVSSTSCPLPISYMHVNVGGKEGNGNLTLSKNSYKFLPGTSITVNSGSSVTLNSGVKVLIYKLSECTNDETYNYTNSAGDVVKNTRNFITNHCKDKYDAICTVIGTLTVNSGAGIAGTILCGEKGNLQIFGNNYVSLDVLNTLIYGNRNLFLGFGKYSSATTKTVMYYANGDIKQYNDVSENQVFANAEYIGDSELWSKKDISIILQYGATNVTINGSGQNGLTLVEGLQQLSEKLGSEYTYNALYFDAEFTKTVDLDTIFFNDFVLYADYGYSGYTITYNANGGTVEDETTLRVNITSSDLESLTLKEPVREGYTFDGWYTNAECLGEKITKLSADSFDENNSLTLYAKWQINSYTITFINGTGVSSVAVSVDGIDIESGSLVEYGKTVIVKATLADNYENLTITVNNANYNSGDSFLMPGVNVTIETSATEKSGSGCVAAGTLITLADGSQKKVEDLTLNDQLLVWNIYTGKFEAAPILFIDSEPLGIYEIIALSFSDGTEVKVISEHGFWDYDLNEYVYLDKNASKYIGHWFNKQVVDVDGNMASTKVQLVKVEIFNEETTAWSPVTYKHLCYYVNGMLSMPGGISGLFNIFEIDNETLTINIEQMQADIERYGLFTYEEFNEILPLNEVMFEVFNGQYLKVAIGKGLITWDTLNMLVDRYSAFFE